MADIKVNNLKIRGSDGNLYEINNVNAELIAKIQILESDLALLKEQVLSVADIDTNDIAKKSELTKIDLSSFPTNDTLVDFINITKAKEYAEKSMLTKIDLSGILSRLKTIEEKLGVTNAES